MISVGNRILLHMDRYKSVRADKYNMPNEITQSGIAFAVGVTRAHVSIELMKLRGKGLIQETMCHVIHTKRMIRVYTLTPEGMNAAESIISGMKDKGENPQTLICPKESEQIPTFEKAYGQISEIMEMAENIRKGYRGEDRYQMIVMLLDTVRVLSMKEGAMVIK